MNEGLILCFLIGLVNLSGITYADDFPGLRRPPPNWSGSKWNDPSPNIDAQITDYLFLAQRRFLEKLEADKQKILLSKQQHEQSAPSFTFQFPDQPASTSVASSPFVATYPNRYGYYNSNNKGRGDDIRYDDVDDDIQFEDVNPNNEENFRDTIIDSKEPIFAISPANPKYFSNDFSANTNNNINGGGADDDGDVEQPSRLSPYYKHFRELATDESRDQFYIDSGRNRDDDSINDDHVKEDQDILSGQRLKPIYLHQKLRPPSADNSNNKNNENNNNNNNVVGVDDTISHVDGVPSYKLKAPMEVKPKSNVSNNQQQREDLKSLYNKLQINGQENAILNNGQYYGQRNDVIKKHMEMDAAMGMYVVALIAGVSAAVTVGLIALGIGWYTLHKKGLAAADVEYPAYGVTGPSKDISPSGDRRLAQSAQMYHYQHQKQQIIAMENHSNSGRNGLSDVESDDENEEGDYTVYECPGLAPTGEMEVKNPLFLDDPTPATPATGNATSASGAVNPTTTTTSTATSVQPSAKTEPKDSGNAKLKPTDGATNKHGKEHKK